MAQVRLSQPLQPFQNKGFAPVVPAQVSRSNLRSYVCFNGDNGASKNNKVTLSADFLTETPDFATSAFQSVRTNAPASPNAFQLEGTLDTAGTPVNLTIGLDNGATDLSVDGNVPGGTDSNGVGIELFGTNWFIVRNGGVSQGPIASPAPAASQVVTVVGNRSAGTASFFVNGAQIGVTETGISFPNWYAYGSGKGSGPQGTVAANFAGPFAYPQSGYSAYDPGTVASPDVTLALTGLSLSAVQGSVAPVNAPPLTGQTLAAAQDRIAAQQAATLTGQPLAASQGTVAPITASALTGQSLTAAQGTVLQGTPLTGQSLTAAIGSVVPGITIALGGQSLSAAAGSVAPGSSPPLTGLSLAVAGGSVVATRNIGLTGLSLAVAQGSLLGSSSIALLGQQLTLSQGTVTVGGSGNVTLALTGLSLSAAQGSLASSSAFALVGQPIAVGQGTTAPASSRSLTGQPLSAAAGTVTASPSATLTGQALAAAQGSVGKTSSVGLTGQSLTLAQGTLITSFNGHAKVWLGAWSAKPVKVWTGSSWTQKPVKRWNGSAWVPTNV